MKWFSNFRNAKYALITLAAVIAVVSLLVSSLIVDDLKREEERRMMVWASAMSSLISADIDEDVSLEEEILSSNKTIPVIMVDENGEILSYNNIPEAKLDGRAAEMLASGTRIEVPLGDGAKAVHHMVSCAACTCSSRRIRRRNSYASLMDASLTLPWTSGRTPRHSGSISR